MVPAREINIGDSDWADLDACSEAKINEKRLHALLVVDPPYQDVTISRLRRSLGPMASFQLTPNNSRDAEGISIGRADARPCGVQEIQPDQAS